VKFQVFKDGQIVNNFRLCGAYLFGTDGITVRRAKITFENGVVECTKSGIDSAAGLALLWPVEGFGQVLLPTTCLPERTEAYILNLEIARAKLMQIINKREDWSFFGDSDELSRGCQEAQDLFIRAVQNISEPATASKLADQSLKKAVTLSEKLTVKQAELLFDIRVKSHGFGRGCLGCNVDIQQIKNPQYARKLLELFGFVTIPVNWGRIESTKGTYDFSELDLCIEILKKKKAAIGAGPLVCFSKEFLPDWLANSRAGFEKIRDTAYNFVSKVAERYSANIRAWRVIGGLNVFNHFGFSFEQALEMTRAANMAVKAISERSLKIIEVSEPWGEYYGTETTTIPPLIYMDTVAQSGINFDAFGLQMRFGKNSRGMYVRDMMHISSILDYFLPIAKPLYITAVEVPSQSSKENATQSGGMWHKSWDQHQQSRWIEQFYKTALSKPYVDSVIYSNLADRQNSVIANSGLLTGDLKEKQSFKSLKKLHELIFTR